MTREEEQRMWEYIHNFPNWWMTLKALPNTSMLTALDKDFRLLFITHRAEVGGLPVEKQSQIWLMHTFGIQLPNVVLAGPKGEIAKSLGCKYFIDDKPENIDDILRDAPECMPFLQDQSYNQHYEKTQRVYNLNDFAKRVYDAERGS